MIRFFNFNFLQKVDRYLLLNHTLIWHIRLPYVLFYGLIINIFFLFFLFFYNVELYQVPILYQSLMYLSSSISFIGLIYWIYIQITSVLINDEFTKFKLNGLKEYLLYLFAIVWISVTPMIVHYSIISTYTYPLKNHNGFYEEYYTVQEIKDLLGNSDENYNLSPIEMRKKARDIGYFLENIHNIYTYINIFFFSYFTIIILSLLLIIYQEIGVKYFIQTLFIFVIIVFFSEFLYVFLGTVMENHHLTLIFWITILLLFSQLIFKNYFRIIFTSIIYLFFMFFVFLNENNIDLFGGYLNDYYQLRTLTILITSFIFIVLIAFFVKKYIVKYKSIPKN